VYICMMACPFTSMCQTKSNQTMDVQEIWHDTITLHGLGSSVSTATDYGLDGLGSNPSGDGIFRPSSLLYNGYRVFPGGKVRPGRAPDHSSPSSAAVMEE